MGDVFEYERPDAYIVSSEQYSDAYPIPVLTANQAFILGYTNEDFGVYNKGEVVLFDDFTCDSKIASFPFKVKSSAMKLLTTKNSIPINYAFELLRYINYKPEGHARHWISIMQPLPVLLPTIEEQQKIGTFLSQISERIEKQKELINLLKKYKRGVISKLLDRSIGCNLTPWTSHKVGDFCTVQMCKRIFKEQTSTDGDVPFFKIGTIGSEPDAFISRELFEEYRQKYNYPRKGEFLISCAGTVGKCVIYNGEDSYYQDSNIVWLRNDSNFVLNEYLYILVSNVDWSTLNSTTITRIYNDNLRDLVFDFPPIEEQKRISDFYAVLDKRIEAEVSTLANLLDLKQGLIQGLFA